MGTWTCHMHCMWKLRLWKRTVRIWKSKTATMTRMIIKWLWAICRYTTCFHKWMFSSTRSWWLHRVITTLIQLTLKRCWPTIHLHWITSFLWNWFRWIWMESWEHLMLQMMIGKLEQCTLTAVNQCTCEVACISQSSVRRNTCSISVVCV